MICWSRQDQLKDWQGRQHKEFALFAKKGATGKLFNLCACMRMCASARARACASMCHNI